MKKRFITVVLVIALFAMLCVNASATTVRVQQVLPQLSFSGTTANCSVTVYGDNDISVELVLKNGSTVVDSWSGSGRIRVFLSGSHKVVSGKTYTLVATGTINGQAFEASTSGTCP